MPLQTVTHRILEQAPSLTHMIRRMVSDAPAGLTTQDIRLLLLDRQMLVDPGELSGCLCRSAQVGKLRRVQEPAVSGARGPRLVWRYYSADT